MTDQELTERFDKIKASMGFADDIIHMDIFDPEFKHYVTKEQKQILQDILNLFRDLNWQVHLNQYRSLAVEEGSPFLQEGCGTPVRVRPIAEEYQDKTFFGIYLGEVPLEIFHTLDADGNLKARRAFYNPAIFVPELGKIIYGVESWWAAIENNEDIERMITDETIEKIWYVRALKAMYGSREEKKGSEE